LMADFVAKIGDHESEQLKRSLWSSSAGGCDAMVLTPSAVTKHTGRPPAVV
jgi:hypothetical protein